jgi:hypothetical protein
MKSCKFVPSVFRIKPSILKNFLLVLSAGLLLGLGCKDQITNPPEKQLYTSIIKGKVTLENQAEYSNCLVYLDSLNRGVSSDSSGNYTISFNEEDSIYSGNFQLIYFLNDYDKDSAEIYLEKGKVKIDTLDVDNEGKIKTREMKQIVRVEGWTDKEEYKIGDSIEYTIRLTNVIGRIIHILITSCNGEMSNFVLLYNDKYPPFQLGGLQVDLVLDCDIDLPPGKYYEAKIKYDIYEYRILIPDEYLVSTDFFIEGRLLNQFQSEFNKYILEEWYKIARGKSPKFDLFPNKYEFPHLKIIQ